MQTDRDQWEAVNFGDVVREITDHERDPEERGLERYVGLDHLDPGDLRIRRWGLISEGVTFTKVFQAGQVLFGKRRVYQKKAGVADFDGLCSGDIIVLEVKDQRMLPEFLPYLVQTDAFFTHAEKTSSGSLSPRTKFRELAQFEFLLPPLEQQRELVELMQGFEAAIEAGEEVVEAAERVDRQLLKELFSQSAGWNSQRLSDVAEVRLGRQRSPDKVRGVRPIKYLRAANVKEGHIDFDDVLEMDFTESEQATYQLQDNDLILVEGGEARDVGMCAMFTRQEQPICFQNTVLRVRVLDRHTVIPEFLFFMFKQLKRDGVFSALSGGTKLKHLGAGNVSALKISLPPQVEQERHVLRLAASGIAVKSAQKQLEHINALRASLVNSILTPSNSAPALVTA